MKTINQILLLELHFTTDNDYFIDSILPYSKVEGNRLS